MPDITTKADYQEYQESIAQFIAREGLRFLSTGTVDRLAPDYDPEAEWAEGESWFSWSPCECCGSHLGGDREYLYARNAADELIQFTICEDCVYYVNYGRLDDQTMERVGASSGLVERELARG
jgi:hypothetical protein